MSLYVQLRGGGPVSAVATVKSPKETYDGMAAKGRDNAKMSIVKILHQSIMGGCYVGFGGLLSTVVAGNCGGIASSNPGLQKFIFAALFPVNLLLILMSGGQLFTGNSAAVPAALFEGLVDVNDLIRSWGVSYIGNIIGCGGFALAASCKHTHTSPRVAYHVNMHALATTDTAPILTCYRPWLHARRRGAARGRH